MKNLISHVFTLIFIFTSFIGENIYAADVGIGAALSNDSSTIYFPVELTDNLRLEPYLSTTKYSSKDGSFHYSSINNTIGIGIFNINHVSDNTNLILGIRTGYTKQEQKSDNYPEYGTKGYSVAPVIGFEYLPVKNVSIGIDTFWQYNHLKDYDDDKSGNSGYRSTSSHTETAITVKYYFM